MNTHWAYLMVMSASFLVGTITHAEDWPAFLGTQGNGKSNEEGLLLKWPATGPPVLWHLPLGSGYGSCTISRGCCFQFDRIADHARLRCLNSITGVEKWTYEYETDYQDLYGYDDGPRCCPVVDGPLVYVFGAEGELHCVRSNDGSRVWSVDTTAEFGVVQNFFGVGSTPVIWEDLLLVMVGGSPPDVQDVAPGRLDAVRGNGSLIVAFDKTTGKVRYQASDDLASYASIQVVKDRERSFAFAFARGGLVGFNPANGELDFRFPWRAKLLESVNASSPVVLDHQVFISETYGPGSCLLSFRPGNYEVIWRDDPESRDKSMLCHWNTPIHHAGHLYGSSGRHAHSADLRCVEWSTGRVVWQQPGLGRTSLLYADGHLIVLSEDGGLRVIRASQEKFDLISESRITTATSGAVQDLVTDPAWAAPVLSDRRLYVRGGDRLVCLDLRPK